MRALIDGDSLVYTIGFACQHDIHQAVEIIEDEETGEKQNIVHFESDNRSMVLAYIEEHMAEGLAHDKRIVMSPPEHAFHSIKIVIQKICQRARANTYKVFLTGPGNFREDLATIMGYKHNRLDKPKPLLYQAIRDYLVRNHSAQIVTGIEADDAMSISYTLSTSGQPINTSKDPNKPVWRYPEEAIICAIDKDLRTVAGKQINFGKHVIDKDGEYQFLVVDEPTARRNFWMQVLTGDTSDNVVGVPRFGEKKAVTALEGCVTEKEYFDATYKCYCAHYGYDWFDYYHWRAYTSSTDAYSKRKLRPEEELEQHPEWKLQGHPLTMLLENARLLHMLRSAPKQDGSHWWMPPYTFDEIMEKTAALKAEKEADTLPCGQSKKLVNKHNKARLAKEKAEKEAAEKAALEAAAQSDDTPPWEEPVENSSSASKTESPSDGESKCNHEPAADCPEHPLTEENQVPVSGERAKEIDLGAISRELLEELDKMPGPNATLTPEQEEQKQAVLDDLKARGAPWWDLSFGDEP